MELSLAQRIFEANRPFVLLHTHSPTCEALERAVSGGRSVDLDISVDGSGDPYLGHSEEYYDVSGETRPQTAPFWEATEMISRANIPVILDCKHHAAWPVVEDAVRRIGAHRCLVHCFASELKFDYQHDDSDYLTEWQPVKRLRSIKDRFPSATTCASCKFLPRDLLISGQYRRLLVEIRDMLKRNRVDTVCLNVPDATMSDAVLEFFLEENILAHIGIDNIDVSTLSKLYVGETDNLASASASSLLGY